MSTPAQNTRRAVSKRRIIESADIKAIRRNAKVLFPQMSDDFTEESFYNNLQATAPTNHHYQDSDIKYSGRRELERRIERAELDDLGNGWFRKLYSPNPVPVTKSLVFEVSKVVDKKDDTFDYLVYDGPLQRIVLNKEEQRIEQYLLGLGRQLSVKELHHLLVLFLEKETAKRFYILEVMLQALAGLHQPKDVQHEGMKIHMCLQNNIVQKNCNHGYTEITDQLKYTPILDTYDKFVAACRTRLVTFRPTVVKEIVEKVSNDQNVKGKVNLLMIKNTKYLFRTPPFGDVKNVVVRSTAGNLLPSNKRPRYNQFRYEYDFTNVAKLPIEYRTTKLVELFAQLEQYILSRNFANVGRALAHICYRNKRYRQVFSEFLDEVHALGFLDKTFM